MLNFNYRLVDVASAVDEGADRRLGHRKSLHIYAVQVGELRGGRGPDV